jgi:Penicillin amidase
MSAIDTGYDAIGASIPGLPGIKFGRNANFAWSETSSGMDSQDLFILSGVNATHYSVNGTIHPFTIKYIPVKVKVADGGGFACHVVTRDRCFVVSGQNRLGVQGTKYTVWSHCHGSRQQCHWIVQSR